MGDRFFLLFANSAAGPLEDPSLCTCRPTIPWSVRVHISLNTSLLFMSSYFVNFCSSILTRCAWIGDSDIGHTSEFLIEKILLGRTLACKFICLIVSLDVPVAYVRDNLFTSRDRWLFLPLKMALICLVPSMIADTSTWKPPTYVASSSAPRLQTLFGCAGLSAYIKQSPNDWWMFKGSSYFYVRYTLEINYLVYTDI